LLNCLIIELADFPYCGMLIAKGRVLLVEWLSAGVAGKE
jgi:hypothetical protein